ncbi:Fanconi anemia group J protein homolog [Hyalella azteca]|uniref:DNA 5'-3' helicase n=1 Tax=Hyalella azteca TaxID=294128 RepID=A0A979FGE0_HYAAZ|nr:Fanconi anemia group J protein homolog [Hyalella azteca]
MRDAVSSNSLIRDAMEIKLRHHVVVLDEAHNIEDCAREAASCQLLIDDVRDALTDVEVVGQRAGKLTQSRALGLFLSILSGWMVQNSRHLQDDSDSSKNSSVFLGSKMIQILDKLEIGRAQWMPIKTCLSEMTDEPPNDEADPPKLKSATLTLLRNIFLMYHFLYDRPVSAADDYRVALCKIQSKNRNFPAAEGGAWLRRRRRGDMQRVSWTLGLNFMCLNPGVAFAEVGSIARNVILTSGTLSPMTSFQSELGVPFAIQLEVNHVIDRKQVWVGTVGQGPNNLPLQATYRFTEMPHFQDELGCLLISVCRAVPRGVLCFLPSYSLLDKLVSRWQGGGIWRGLGEKKRVFIEPRRSEEFERTISDFYDTITNTRYERRGGVDGALLLAVCRGKVSEGLDFTDDNARAVVAVGIPFPNFKDAQVTHKREYNTQHHRSRGLLSGSDWYEIQAYRALNQALGRCLRHRYDWGALLLVDVRYQQRENQGQHNRYIRSLSRWVRDQVVHHSSFKEALLDLSEFAQRLSLNPPKKPVTPIKKEANKSPPLTSGSEGYSAMTSFASHKLATGPCSSTTSTLVPKYELKSCASNDYGPMTSTQINFASTSGETGTKSSLLLDIIPPELSQISSCDTGVLNRTLDDDVTLLTDTTAVVDLTLPVSSDTRHSHMALEEQKILCPRGLDTNAADKVSTPSSQLANLVSAKLLTTSPSTLSSLSSTCLDRKRRQELPARNSPAKKECNTLDSSLDDSPKRKFTFTSAKKILALSPAVKSSDSTDSEFQSVSSVTHVKSEINGISRLASSFLFDDTSDVSENLPDILNCVRPTGVPSDGKSDQSELPSLNCRPVKPVVVSPPSDDSDMDDFDMDKSLRRSPEIKRRVRQTIKRNRGVVFSKFQDES